MDAVLYILLGIVALFAGVELYTRLVSRSEFADEDSSIYQSKTTASEAQVTGGAQIELSAADAAAANAIELEVVPEAGVSSKKTGEKAVRKSPARIPNPEKSPEGYL